MAIFRPWYSVPQSSSVASPTGTCPPPPAWAGRRPARHPGIQLGEERRQQLRGDGRGAPAGSRPRADASALHLRVVGDPCGPSPRSAAPSTSTWQLPGGGVHHRHLRNRLRRGLQALAPRRMIRSTSPSSVASSASCCRPSPISGETAASGRPSRPATPRSGRPGRRSKSRRRSSPAARPRSRSSGRAPPRRSSRSAAPRRRSDHPERRPLLPHLQPVLKRPTLHDLAQRVLQLRDLAHPRRHLGHPASVSDSRSISASVRPSSRPASTSAAIRLQQISGAGLDAVGEVAQAGILRRAVGAREPWRLLRRHADVMHALGASRHHDKGAAHLPARGYQLVLVVPLRLPVPGPALVLLVAEVLGCRAIASSSSA